MISKKYRLALAKMLKLYKEISTEQGNLVAEAEEIVVGTEVFVDGEEGMTPAQDGEYVDTVNNLIYVVVGGTVTEIKEKENTLEENLEDNQEKGSDNGEENNKGSQDGTGDDNGSKDGTGDTGKMEDNAEMDALKGELEAKNDELEAKNAENETLKAKVAELEATVSDLEDQIAAYKAKEEETAPSAEDAEKFSKQGTGDRALDKKIKAAQAIKSVYSK